MFICYLRAIVLYLLLIAVIRLMGKRQLGEMEPSEFVVAILIADLASVPMQDIGTPLLSGVIPILTVLALELMLSTLSLRSVRFRRLLCGSPVVLMEDGRILQRNLKRTRITVDELIEMLRIAGTTELKTVYRAILETNGQLSVLLRNEYNPASAKDACIKVKQIALPVAVISDGRILHQNLRAVGYDLGWLNSQLRAQNLSVEDVFLLTVAPGCSPYLLKKEDT